MWKVFFVSLSFSPSSNSYVFLLTIQTFDLTVPSIFAIHRIQDVRAFNFYISSISIFLEYCIPERPLEVVKIDTADTEQGRGFSLRRYEQLLPPTLEPTAMAACRCSLRDQQLAPLHANDDTIHHRIAGLVVPIAPSRRQQTH